MGLLETLTDKVSKYIQKAEDVLDELDFTLKQPYINNALAKYVVANVEAIEGMQVHLFEGWLRLNAVIHFQNCVFRLNTDLKLVECVIHPDKQHLVFEQLSPTRVIDVHYHSWYQRYLFRLGLWGFKLLKRKDPLGVILQRLDVVEVRYGLLHMDLNRYFKDHYKIIRAIQKLQIEHAVVKDGALVIKSNVNLKALMGLSSYFDELEDDREIL